MQGQTLDETGLGFHLEVLTNFGGGLSSLGSGQGVGLSSGRERVLHRLPAGPNPLYHRDEKVDRPRAMEV